MSNETPAPRPICKCGHAYGEHSTFGICLQSYPVSENESKACPCNKYCPPEPGEGKEGAGRIKCESCGGLGYYPLMPDGQNVECSECEGAGSGEELVDELRLAVENQASSAAHFNATNHDAERVSEAYEALLAYIRKLEAAGPRPSSSQPLALEQLIRAGVLLSNCAFNMKQWANVDADTKRSLEECQKRWDLALRVYRDGSPSPESLGGK